MGDEVSKQLKLGKGSADVNVSLQLPVIKSLHAKCKRSRPDVFCKKGAPKNFTKFPGKHWC